MTRWQPAEQRFWASVDRRGADECWVWTGYLRNDYGSLWVEGRNEYAHRFSFLLHGGELGPNEQACHTCDNPPCVNPRHLFAGANDVNQADMRQKGRGIAPPVIAGEAHPFAKLTDAQVTEIRQLARSGVSQSELGRRFGVAHSTIWRFVHGVARTSA